MFLLRGELWFAFLAQHVAELSEAANSTAVVLLMEEVARTERLSPQSSTVAMVNRTNTSQQSAKNSRQQDNLELFQSQNRAKKSAEVDRDELQRQRAETVVALAQQALNGSHFASVPASMPTASQATIHPPYQEFFTKLDLVQALKYKCQKFPDGTAIDTAIYSQLIRDVVVSRDERNSTSPSSGKTYRFKVLRFDVIYNDPANGQLSLTFDDRKLPQDEAGARYVGVQNMWSSRVTYSVNK